MEGSIKKPRSSMRWPFHVMKRGEWMAIYGRAEWILASNGARYYQKNKRPQWRFKCRYYEEGHEDIAEPHGKIIRTY